MLWKVKQNLVCVVCSCMCTCVCGHVQPRGQHQVFLSLSTFLRNKNDHIHSLPVTHTSGWRELECRWILCFKLAGPRDQTWVCSPWVAGAPLLHFTSPPPCFKDSFSHWTWTSLIGYTDSEHPGSPHLPPQLWNYRNVLSSRVFYCGFWGTKSAPPCLHKPHFITSKPSS